MTRKSPDKQKIVDDVVPVVEEKKESNAGRPTVMTPDIISKLEEVFALGGTDEEACFFAGIGKTTLYEYQKDNPEFTERKEGLKDSPILLARRTVVDAVKMDSDMAMKYLERKKKDEFSLRHGLDLGVDKEGMKSLTEFFRIAAKPTKLDEPQSE